MVRKITLALAVLALLALAQPADACNVYRCWIVDSNGNPIACGICIILSDTSLSAGQSLFAVGDTQLTRLANGHVQVAVDGLESVGISAGDTCSVGLNAVTGLQTVNSVKVVHSETGQVFDQFNFAPNFRTAEAYSREGELSGMTDGRWLGFLAQASREIPLGTPLKYVFDVSLKAGTKLERFGDALRTEGAFGAGSADERGNLTLGHVELTPFAKRPVLFTLPGRREHDGGAGRN